MTTLAGELLVKQHKDRLAAQSATAKLQKLFYTLNALHFSTARGTTNLGHTHKRNVVTEIVTSELEKTNEQGEQSFELKLLIRSCLLKKKKKKKKATES